MNWEDIGPSKEEIKQRYPRKGGVDDEGRTQYQVNVAALTADSSKLDPEMPYESAQAQDQAINDLLNPIVQGAFDISDKNIQNIIGSFQEDIGVAQPQQTMRHPHSERWMKGREADYEEAVERNHEKKIGLLQDDLDRLISMGAPAVENVRDLATLAMAMHKSDDATAREEAQALFHLFKDYPPFHHLVEVETNYQTTFDDLYQPPSGPNPILSAIGWTFETLFRPVSAVIPIVMDIKNLDFKSAVSRSAQSGIDLLDFFTPDFITDKGILASAESWLEEHESDLGQYDLNGDGRISIKESGLNPLSDVPVLGATTDFLAEVMFDPLTWATLGVGGIVKGAMKAGGKTILTATASPTGAKNFFRAAGAIKRGGLVDKLGDDVFLRTLHHIKNGFDTGIPWKKLRKQIADDLGENYSDEMLDEVLRVVMSGSRTGREAAKRIRLDKKVKGMGGDSIRKERLERRIKGIGEDLKIGDDGISNLINEKSRKISRRIKQIQKRSGGGLAFGAGTHKYYVPGTRGLYQWFKKNGIAITPAKFLMGSRKLPALFGKGYASIKPTGGIIDDLHYMGWGAEVIHQAGPRAGGYSLNDFVRAWKEHSLNNRAREVVDPKTGKVEKLSSADPAFQRTRTAGAAPETEGGVGYKRPGHADEGMQLSDEITPDQAKRILEMMEEAGAVSKDKYGNYHQTWKNRTPRKDARYEPDPTAGARLASDPPDPREVAMEAFVQRTRSGDAYVATAKSIEEWINNPFAFAPPQGVKVEDLFIALERRIDRIDNRIDELLKERRTVRDRIIAAEADVALTETPEIYRQQVDELQGELSRIDREIDAMEEIAQELTDQQHYIQALVERFHGWDTIDEVTTSPLAKAPPKVFSDEAIEGAEEVTNYKDPVVESGPRITQSEGPVYLSNEERDKVREEVYEEFGINEDDPLVELLNKAGEEHPIGNPRQGSELYEGFLERPERGAEKISDDVMPEVAYADEIEQVFEGPTLWHGAFKGDLESFIDPETGELILRASDNFEGRTYSVSFAEDYEVAEDYATRVKGGGPEARDQGLIFEIEKSAVNDQGIDLAVDESERASWAWNTTRGEDEIRIPKDRFRVVDTRTREVAEEADELISYDRQRAASFSDEQLVDEFMDAEVAMETAEYWTGDTEVLGLMGDPDQEWREVLRKEIWRRFKSRAKSPEELQQKIQLAKQEIQLRISNLQKPVAKAEKVGNKNQVKRLIESHKSNPRSGMVVKRIQDIEAGLVPAEEITDRERRRINRHNNVMLPGRSQADGALRPSDWFRRAEKWSENMAIGGDAAAFDAETLQMWGGGVQAIGDEKTVTLVSGKKVNVVHPTGAPDLPTPRRKIATTDTAESAAAELKKEMGDLWDEMPHINETARAWENAKRNANKRNKKTWDALNEEQKKTLVRKELVNQRVNLSRRGVLLEVSENGKFWHSLSAPSGTKGTSKLKLNPTTAFDAEDVGSYQPLGYFDYVQGKRPDVESKKAIGFEPPEDQVGDVVASGTREAVFAENLENEHAWHLIRTNIDSMIDILTVAEANGMGSWDEILRILDDADWDDDLVTKLTNTPFGNKGIRDPAEMQILGNPNFGPPRSAMPLGLKDMLGNQTQLHYQLAAPKGLVAKGVHRVTKPFLGTVRYGLKKTESLRSFVKLGQQGNKIEREVARESKSRNMANARMEHDTRMTVLTKYREDTEKVFKANGVPDPKGALIRAINKVRLVKVGENRDAVYKELADELGEESAERVKRIVTEIDNYSHSQLEIIEDVLSRELKIRNPNYNPDLPRTDVQYDADGVAIPTAKGAKYNPKYIPLDPETYNPRVLTPEAEKAFIDIFKDNGDPAMRLYRAELANGETMREHIEVAAKKAGWDEETTQQAIEEWGKLFGGLKQAGSQAAPEALNGSLNAARMFSTLAESGHMKAREFLPQIQNVQEINQFINDVLDQVAKTVKKLSDENGGVVEGWGITRFYEEDPIDAWIRYSSSYQHQQVTYDFLNDMEELRFNDILDPTGESFVDRPAVFKSEFEIVEPLKPTFDEVLDDRTILRVDSKDPQYKMTIEGVNGDTIVMRSHARETKDEFLNRVRARVSEDAGGASYEVVPVGSGARIVDSELAREIQENVIGQLKNNHLQGKASQFVNRWTTGWATYATVPLIGFAFHMRNAVGNFFNMAVAGVRNPAVIVDAMRMQALNRGVKKFMQENSYLSYDEALDALVDGEVGGLDKIVKGISRVTADDRIKLRMLRDSAIVNPGFFQDLGRDAGIFDRKGGTNKATRLGNAYINNPVTKLGRGMGTLIEDNARIALFLDGVDKGMDVYEAGMRTKEYLFDYTELTRAERKVKNFSRFYTWMRKNTALQMRMMVSQPGSVWNTQKMVDGIIQNILGLQSGMNETFLPEWAEDRNWLFNPHDMYMARMETPLISAIETLEKGAYLTTIGDLNPLLPWDYRESSLGQRLADSFGLFASGPQSGLTAFVEEAMGKSMYSGATLNDGPAWTQVYRLVVNPMIPAVTKLAREGGKLTGFDPLNVVTDHQEMESFWSDEDKRNIRLANLFFGVSVYSLNEEQQMRHIGFVRGQYDDIRKEMRDSGIEIPTMAELREDNAYNEADRVAKILIFSQSSAAAIDKAVQENVWDLLEEYGLPREYVAPNPEKTMEEHRDDVRVQIALAEQVLNRGREGLAPLEFPPEWKLKIALAVHGGLTTSELEAFGIEPLRENQFLNSPSEEEDLVRMNTALNIVLDAAGITNAQAREFRPVLPDAIRYVKDKVEMGVNLNQAVWDYILELSRRKRQELGIPLDVLAYDKTPTASEIRKMIQKTRQSVAEIMMISWAFGINATEADIQHWILYGDTNLPAASLERLGLPTAPKQTRREDARSDEQKLQGDLITLESLTAGGMPAIR